MPAAKSPLVLAELPPGQRARRLRILEAALTKLEEQPYELIQVREVGALAGVAMGTLYRYFLSKEHLYAAALIHWSSTGDAMAVPREADELPTAEERLRVRLHGVITAFAANPRHYRTHLALRSSTDPNAMTYMAQIDQGFREAVMGDLAALGDQAARDGALMCWAIVDTGLSEALLRGGPLDDVHRVLDRLLDMLAIPLRWVSP